MGLLFGSGWYAIIVLFERNPSTLRAPYYGSTYCAPPDHQLKTITKRSFMMPAFLPTLAPLPPPKTGTLPANPTTRQEKATQPRHTCHHSLSIATKHSLSPSNTSSPAFGTPRKTKLKREIEKKKERTPEKR